MTYLYYLHISYYVNKDCPKADKKKVRTIKHRFCTLLQYYNNIINYYNRNVHSTYLRQIIDRFLQSTSQRTYYKADNKYYKQSIERLCYGSSSFVPNPIDYFGLRIFGHKRIPTSMIIIITTTVVSLNGAPDKCGRVPRGGGTRPARIRRKSFLRRSITGEELYRVNIA